jgi:hypothetical protein
MFSDSEELAMRISVKIQLLYLYAELHLDGATYKVQMAVAADALDVWSHMSARFAHGFYLFLACRRRQIHALETLAIAIDPMSRLWRPKESKYVTIGGMLLV